MPAVKYKNSRGLCRRAKEYGRHASLSERVLWEALTSLEKETGLKFRRQHPLNPYIADFACIKLHLIIELDGQSHDTRLAYDAKREAELRRRGWTIIRFDNDDVLTNRDEVLYTIQKKAHELLQDMAPPRSYGEDAKT